MNSMPFADPKKNIAQLALEPGMVVADFGGGAGYLAVEAAEAVGKDGRVYVIDIQQELLTKATHLAEKHLLERISFIHGDLEKSNGSTLPDASVDVVVLSNILFQIENKAAVVDEARRIVRDGGRVFVVDWKESYGGLGPQAEHVFPEDKAKTLFTGAGLEQIREIDAGTYHYGLIYKKNG
jgi:ubiquinone/menaquinone biosynthesis C-methylase UbiE